MLRALHGAQLNLQANASHPAAPKGTPRAPRVSRGLVLGQVAIDCQLRLRSSFWRVQGGIL